MDDLVSLREVSLKEAGTIGQKAAHIAELYNKQFPVPPAFLINGTLFVKFTEMTGLKDKIAELLNSGMEANKKSLEIQKAVVGTPFPEELGVFLYENYASLNVQDNNASSMVESQQEPYVSLRVSSTSEEVADVFFLNIRGKERLLNGIKACWASLFSEKNLPLKRFKPCVIVQKMVNSKKSGYIYSSNPRSSNPNEIMIEVCSGLGNALSLEQAKPSRYIVSKEEFSVLSSDLVEQLIQYSLDFSQEKTVKLNLEEPIKNIMDDYIIRELAKFGKKVEMRFNEPQRVNFAIDKHIYVLGSKPVELEQLSETVEKDKAAGVQDIDAVTEQRIDNGQNPEEPTSDEEFSDAQNFQKDYDRQETGTQEMSDLNDEPHISENERRQEEPSEEQVLPPGENRSFSEENTQKNLFSEGYMQEDLQEDSAGPGENISPGHEAAPQDQRKDDFGDEENIHIQEKDEDDTFIDYEKTIEESDDSLEHYDTFHTGANANARAHGSANESQAGSQEMPSRQRTLDSGAQASTNFQDRQEDKENISEEKEKSSFMSQYVNSKPELAYQKAISFNSSMLVVGCDMTILSALKNKYKSVFSKESHNYFNEIINELKSQVDIPYEKEIKDIRKLRDNFLNEFRELSPNETSFVLDYTRKFLSEF